MKYILTVTLLITTGAAVSGDTAHGPNGSSSVYTTGDNHIYIHNPNTNSTTVIHDGREMYWEPMPREQRPRLDGYQGYHGYQGYKGR